MQTVYNPDFRILRNLACLLVAFLLLTGCAAPTPASLPATPPPATPTSEPAPLVSPTPEPTNPSTRPFEPALATPASAEPAAGICMQAEGETAVVEIYPDAPAPRCLKVTAAQRLVVVNRTDSEISVSLGALAAVIQPGEQIELDLPLGKYLAPGVHRVQAEPYSGPEVWLVED